MTSSAKWPWPDIQLRRRDLLKASAALAGAGAAAPLISACGSSQSGSGSGTNSVVFASYGGLFQQTFQSNILNPAQKALHITIDTVADLGTASQLAALVDAHHDAWGVQESTDTLLATEESLGVLQNLDLKSLQVSDLDASYVRADGVAWCSYANNVSYNTKVFGNNGPVTVADMFNTKKFPGRRWISNTADPAIQLALLGDGVEPSQLYPLDLERAFAKLTQLRNTGQAVFTDLNTATNQVAQQDIVIAFLNTTRLIELKKSSVPITWGWEQYTVDLDWLTIGKGAPDRAAAYKVINYIVSPGPQRKLPSVFGYGVVNRKAVETLSVTEQQNLPLTPYTKAGAIPIDISWWGKYGNTANQMMTAWLAQ